MRHGRPTATWKIKFLGAATKVWKVPNPKVAWRELERELDKYFQDQDINHRYVESVSLHTQLRSYVTPIGAKPGTPTNSVTYRAHFKAGGTAENAELPLPCFDHLLMLDGWDQSDPYAEKSFNLGRAIVFLSIKYRGIPRTPDMMVFWHKYCEPGAQAGSDL
jgi:hypothetical protein